MIKEILRSRRKKLGLSQQQVAELVGISRSFYTRIELGTERPSLDVAFKIAKTLGLDVNIFDLNVRMENKIAM